MSRIVCREGIYRAVLLAALWVVLGQLLASPAARAIELDKGGLNIRLGIEGNAQGAYAEDRLSGNMTWDGRFDWAARLNLEYTTRSGLVFGGRVEYDQDFDVESEQATARAADVERDEAYVYLAGRFGRIEVGEQDGPVDALSFAAPIIGMGQVRGEFARYASKQALLTALDTQDALKAIYLSPPFGGLRFGVSYGPKMARNTADPDPLNRTIQRNHVEVAAQYEGLLGRLPFGISAAYVRADADPITGRQDVESWSVGSELRWKIVRIGAGYVERGDSDAFVGLDESEVNAGIAFETRHFRLAVSAAEVDSSLSKRQLAGAGLTLEIAGFLTLRGDAVYYDETFKDLITPRDKGVVGLAEIGLHF